MAGGALTEALIGVLLSEQANSTHGERIDAIGIQEGTSLTRFTDPLPPSDLAKLTIAFYSRDLFEGSNVRAFAERSNRFFAHVDSAPNLSWLHVFSSGLDLPPYGPSIARGIEVTGSTGATAEPIAQSVLAAILAQSRGFDHWLNAQRRRQWLPLHGTHRPREIAGQRAVIVGAGPIGVAIADLLHHVGFHVTAIRRTREEMPSFDAVATFDELDSLLPTCDWLVLACPLTDTTHGLIDARRLALMPASARLANVARGEVVDELALITALQQRRIAGAFLDVFGVEPLPPDSPLWQFENVWITPHNCATAMGHEDRVAESFLSRLGPWLRRWKSIVTRPD